MIISILDGLYIGLYGHHMYKNMYMLIMYVEGFNSKIRSLCSIIWTTSWNLWTLIHNHVKAHITNLPFGQNKDSYVLQWIQFDYQRINLPRIHLNRLQLCTHMDMLALLIHYVQQDEIIPTLNAHLHIETYINLNWDS